MSRKVNQSARKILEGFLRFVAKEISEEQFRAVLESEGWWFDDETIGENEVVPIAKFLVRAVCLQTARTESLEESNGRNG